MRATRCLALSLAGLMALLSTWACDCDDSGFQDAAPRIDRYHVGTSPIPPALESFQAIPIEDRLRVDFGLVDVRVAAHRYLLIRNEGTLELQLLGVDVDPATSPDFRFACLEGGTFVAGCPYSATGPLGVAPGRDLTLELTYTPGETGPDQGALTLRFAPASLLHANLVVELSGQGVTPEVQVCFRDCRGAETDPACQAAAEMCNDQVDKERFILDFGDADVGASRTRELVVRNLGQKPLDVREVALVIRQNTGMNLDYGQLLFPLQVPIGGQIQLQVGFSPPWGGEFRDNLRVTSSDVTEPEVEFPVVGRGVAPRVCPEPVVVDFGVIRVGQVVTQPLVIRSCGLQTLRLDRLELAPQTSPDFSLPVLPGLPDDLAPDEVVEVTVQYAPMGPGSDSGGVAIFSNDQSSDPVTGLSGTVTLLGRAVDAACDIEVTPFAVSFGVVPVNSQNQTSLIVTNAGSDTCVIERIELTRNSAQDEFGLQSGPGLPLTLLPGDASPSPVVLTYGPVDLGQDVGVLSIFANDKDGPENRVDLNGFARPDGDGPIAVCSANPAQAMPFQNVLWDGSRSYDTSPNRTITQYNWTIFAFPPGSAARLLGTGPNRTTQVDLAGQYIAQLVVVNDLGQQSTPCYAETVVTPSEELWIEMFWTYRGDDMDLHLLAPSGLPRTRTDCYFGNCQRPAILDWGQAGYAGDNPHLDLDDIPGTGPENINIAVPAPGTYTVFVHDYPGSTYNGPNPVTVRVYINGSLQATFNHTISGENVDWYVCDIDWPSGTITPR